MRQFPDKKTVGIPPDFVRYRQEAQNFSEQARQSAEEAAELVDASKDLVDKEIDRCEAAVEGLRERFGTYHRMATDAEWKRVIAENERKAAEREREKTIVTLSAELEAHRRGLNALGALVNARDYMLLGDILHLSPQVASFDGETLVIDGAEIVDGVLVIDGELYY